MSYTRTNWVNGSTPINADNLNNIETGILDLESELSGMTAQSGTVAISRVDSGGYYDAEITFPNAFDSVPHVHAMLYSGSTAGGCGNLSIAIKSSSITATGFTARVYNNDSSYRAPSVYWIAFIV